MGNYFSSIRTQAYCAPEIFLEKGYDSSVDVFSFGVTLFEMITCREDLNIGSLVSTDESIFNAIDDALQKSDSLSILKGIVKDCIQIDPSMRPHLSQLIKRLKGNQYNEFSIEKEKMYQDVIPRMATYSISRFIKK